MEIGPKGTFNDVAANGPSLKWRINGHVCEWAIEENSEMRFAAGSKGN